MIKLRLVYNGLVRKFEVPWTNAPRVINFLVSDLKQGNFTPILAYLDEDEIWTNISSDSDMLVYLKTTNLPMIYIFHPNDTRKKYARERKCEKWVKEIRSLTYRSTAVDIDIGDKDALESKRWEVQEIPPTQENNEVDGNHIPTPRQNDEQYSSSSSYSEDEQSQESRPISSNKQKRLRKLRKKERKVVIKIGQLLNQQSVIEQNLEKYRNKENRIKNEILQLTTNFDEIKMQPPPSNSTPPVPQTEDDTTNQEPENEYSPQLQTLLEMGFHDTTTCRLLLKEFNGDIGQVVQMMSGFHYGESMYV